MSFSCSLKVALSINRLVKLDLQKFHEHCFLEQEEVSNTTFLILSESTTLLLVQLLQSNVISSQNTLEMLLNCLRMGFFLTRSVLDRINIIGIPSSIDFKHLQHELELLE